MEKTSQEQSIKFSFHSQIKMAIRFLRVLIKSERDVQLVATNQSPDHSHLAYYEK